MKLKTIWIAIKRIYHRVLSHKYEVKHLDGGSRKITSYWKNGQKYHEGIYNKQGSPRGKHTWWSEDGRKRKETDWDEFVRY